ncbi:hypothetical protein [Cyclobacterium sp.]|uniref:hypothetical protein n=1 Tax=Cyclobacterium sp. TaxID=1966343 RepID=UPI0019B1C442|nr:hypothetical protein [Cyclobacterium sp.]MBD3629524.1 hypothetical protein [Cyclobacterium sp.]
MLLILSANAIAAQGFDIRLGLGSFSLNRDYGYERPAVGWYYSIGLTHDWTPEWTMGTVFNRSFNAYFRESVAETPIIIGDLPIRSEIISDHFSFILSRKFPLPLGLKGRIGLGLGLAVDENRFYQPILFDEERGAYRGFNLVDQYAVGLIFPGQISLHKSLGNRLRLGLQAGIMMDQQFRMRESYWGPELGYRF